MPHPTDDKDKPDSQADDQEETFTSIFIADGG